MDRSTDVSRQPGRCSGFHARKGRGHQSRGRDQRDVDRDGAGRSVVVGVAAAVVRLKCVGPDRFGAEVEIDTALDRGAAVDHGREGVVNHPVWQLFDVELAVAVRGIHENTEKQVVEVSEDGGNAVCLRGDGHRRGVALQVHLDCVAGRIAKRPIVDRVSGEHLGAEQRLLGWRKGQRGGAIRRGRRSVRDDRGGLVHQVNGDPGDSRARSDRKCERHVAELARRTDRESQRHRCGRICPSGHYER